ncbi:hypothetical protein [Anaeroselena agilis]|uniref:CopC domain-containing protein n=1 Tax=Anaeroselena agilis TaxID=3063788 RepID=A0ABU3P157_9FIRM|nr:hypothetical protein [Selenomonadales bacterium 4137-cl]
MRFFMVFLLVAAMTAGVSAPTAGAWGEHLAAPSAIGPGTAEAPGPVLPELTPELTFKGVGQVTYVSIFDADKPMTLAEQASGSRKPVLTAMVREGSLVVPAGVLQAGHRYSWNVESVYSPGTRSEAVKRSRSLFFSTAGR